MVTRVMTAIGILPPGRRIAANTFRHVHENPLIRPGLKSSSARDFPVLDIISYPEAGHCASACWWNWVSRFTVVIPTQPPPSRRVAIWLIIEFNLLHWFKNHGRRGGLGRWAVRLILSDDCLWFNFRVSYVSIIIASTLVPYTAWPTYYAEWPFFLYSPWSSNVKFGGCRKRRKNSTLRMSILRK